MQAVARARQGRGVFLDHPVVVVGVIPPPPRPGRCQPSLCLRVVKPGKDFHRCQLDRRRQVVAFPLLKGVSMVVSMLVSVMMLPPLLVVPPPSPPPSRLPVVLG